ncbi:unnamed protein product (macronuclear) [Paramecium tetraurelia]|uniref:Protein kinase domain-containing protein n=1 Tax=Paramecium tetraurelia TaxID=5888 RepID=A0DP01_PARTE|nr:uncharacterized protein GSPATT00018964001 [Paramecium tetraurelia]CAK84768.1 unnamed protein product [Paramecium tetraurelia]|eukprot:XP_001452165.1 hypothetical protein (macronuclear) [Paramecium tetraurelia strain d4-2]
MKSIGNYILGKTIGEGTFGQVKLGQHTITNETVAIKILEKSKMKENIDYDRISREINCLKKLRHPNIIQIYEIVQTVNSLYLIMEYAPGGELFQVIIKNQRLNEKDAAEYMMQILSGVQYMHDNYVMHRDLKPENLLLDENNKIKIVDFGLSNQFKDGQLLKTACGSPCYAAPEMIQGKEYDPKSADTWSCGVILFAMVNGYLPFEDKNLNLLYKKIMNCEYATPKYMSPLCKDLLEKILQVNPLIRYNIQQIVQHYWIQTCITNPILTPGYGEINICQEVLEKLATYNFKLPQAYAYLKANKHDPVTTTYYLLLNKHLREKQQDPDETFQYKLIQIPPPQHPQIAILKETSNVQSQKISQVDTKENMTPQKNLQEQKSTNSQKTLNIENSEQQKISQLPDVQNQEEVEEIKEKFNEFQNLTDISQINPVNNDQFESNNEQQYDNDVTTNNYLNISAQIPFPERPSLQTSLNNTPIYHNDYNSRLRQVSLSIEKKPETLFPTVEQIKLKAMQFKQRAFENADHSPANQKPQTLKTPQRSAVYRAPNFHNQHSHDRPQSPLIVVKQHEGPYHLNQLVFTDPQKLTQKIISHLQSQNFDVKRSKFEIKISKCDFAMTFAIALLCDSVYVIKCEKIQGDSEEYEKIYKQIIQLR